MKGDSFQQLKVELDTSEKALKDLIDEYSKRRLEQAKINSWFSPIAIWISIAAFAAIMAGYSAGTEAPDLEFALPISATAALVPLIAFAAKSNLTIQRSNSDLQEIGSRIRQQRNTITTLRLRIASAELDEKGAGGSRVQRQ